MLTGRIEGQSVAAGTEAKLLGPSTKRVNLLFSTDSAGPVYFRNDSKGATAFGLNIVNTSGVYEFPYWKYGDLIFNDWWVFNGGAAAVNVGVLEILH